MAMAGHLYSTWARHAVTGLEAALGYIRHQIQHQASEHMQPQLAPMNHSRHPMLQLRDQNHEASVTCRDPYLSNPVV